jgi:DNA-binding XRE family transcriptional regulator
MNRNTKEQICKLLRSLRKEAGYTQIEMSKKMGVCRETIVAIENLHIGSVNKLELWLVMRWWVACKLKANIETKSQFSSLLKKAFDIE